ncbi:hypothetical protein, partial [Klebsiella pneumoniae]|uniref:hypothetical protein n=1 Tax=Klebsiella pneumoniae TaxID=573 RepID=UPI001F4A462D
FYFFYDVASLCVPYHPVICALCGGLVIRVPQAVYWLRWIVLGDQVAGAGRVWLSVASTLAGKRDR